MLNRKERTLELYMDAGAKVRLLKAVAAEATTALSKVTPAADTDKMVRALNTIDRVCSETEDRMFADYPELPNSYIHVFYGDLSGKAYDDTDAQMIERARKAADKIWE